MQSSHQLAQLLWDDCVPNQIVQATNAYARAKPARKWRPLTAAGLKSFISITITFGIARLPSHRRYWPYRRNGGILGSPAPSPRLMHAATYKFPYLRRVSYHVRSGGESSSTHHLTLESVAKSFTVQEHTSATIFLPPVLGDLIISPGSCSRQRECVICPIVPAMCQHALFWKTPIAAPKGQCKKP